MDTPQQTLERAKYYRERLASLAASCKDKGRETHELSLADIEAIAAVLDALVACDAAEQEKKQPGS
jgi:hypothetical protein